MNYMPNLRYVLDTNIISYILQKDPQVLRHVANALTSNAEFLLCPIVFYEVRRGFLWRDARQQLDKFLTYIASFTWEDFTREDWETAAQLWANLRQQGTPVGEADVLIAAYVIQHQATLVTNNEKHFQPLGVSIENWHHSG